METDHDILLVALETKQFQVNCFFSLEIIKIPEIVLQSSIFSEIHFFKAKLMFAEVQEKNSLI